MTSRASPSWRRRLTPSRRGEHRRHAVCARGVGEDVHERPARVPVGPSAFAGQADEVRVVQIERDAERIRAVLIVVVGEIVPHPDEEVGRASELARAARRPPSRCRCRRRLRCRRCPWRCRRCRPPPSCRHRRHRRPRPRSRKRPPPPARAAQDRPSEQAVGSPQPKFRRPTCGSGNMLVMSRLMVGVATVAAVVAVAGSARGQATPGPRKLRASAGAPRRRILRTPGKSTRRSASELGPGGVLTNYDQTKPQRAAVLHRAAREYDISPHWAGGLTLRQWWLPGSNHATMYAVTARFEPVVSRFGRAFVDAAIGATSTRYAWAFGFDIGGGIEWDVPGRPVFRSGPSFATTRWSTPIAAAAMTDAPGRWANRSPITSVARRPGQRAARALGARWRRYRISVPDADHDGSATTSTSARTSRRASTPIRSSPAARRIDEDGDDVPDVDDPCPVTAPGDNPDRKRPGCPLVDTDKDGIPDARRRVPVQGRPGDVQSDALRLPVREKKRGPAPKRPRRRRPNRPTRPRRWEEASRQVAPAGPPALR